MVISYISVILACVVRDREVHNYQCKNTRSIAGMLGPWIIISKGLEFELFKLIFYLTNDVFNSTAKSFKTYSVTIETHVNILKQLTDNYIYRKSWFIIEFEEITLQFMHIISPWLEQVCQSLQGPVEPATKTGLSASYSSSFCDERLGPMFFAARLSNFKANISPYNLF